MKYFRRNTLGRLIAISAVIASLVVSMPMPTMAEEVAAEITEIAPEVIANEPEAVSASPLSADTEDDGALNANKTPRQVNAHIGDDPSTQINFTYATVADARTQVVINAVGSAETITETGESAQANHLTQSDINDNPDRNPLMNSGKFMHKIAVSDLEPDTEYEYTVGYGENTYSGTFKTALPAGSKESFNFIYIADTQVSNAANAKALGATLARVNEMDPDFVYLAGDTTDTNAEEAEWEFLFNNGGAYPTGGQDMFGNSTIVATQGNHDDYILNRHINAPGKAGNIVYSFDYGPATFIILNLETARSNADAREQQKAYLTSAVADAKARNQWTIVGFHKSLYSGASHITDSDVIAARMFWCPYFAELDVDFVLQGHDHVYSRGFIEADGAKAEVAMAGDATYIDPANAPLYMIGGHAGGLKWYERIDYTNRITPGDPLIPGYAFLDVNAAGIQADGGPGSEVKQEQVIVALEVSEEEISVNTTMFKYDTNADAITTPEYVYDSFTVKRSVSEEPNGLDVTTDANLETGGSEDYFRVNTSLQTVAASNTAKITYTYDTEKFAFRGYTAPEGVTVLDSADTAVGRTITVMIDDYTALDFGQALFSGKGVALASGRNTMTVAVDYVVKAADNTKSLANAVGSVSFTSIGEGGVPGDYDGDGVITLIDLSNIIDLFGEKSGGAAWDKAQLFDINGNGEIDIYDISSIAKRLQ